MVRVRSIDVPLDEALEVVEIDDFSGGLDSETDPQDLSLNTSPDCQNVKFTKNGRVIGRDGFLELNDDLSTNADGVAFFRSSSGSRVIALWHNGSLYDFTGHTLATVVDAASYTAGNPIAWTVQNNIVYWSDGVTPLRLWDPSGATATGAVANTGGGGYVAVPAAKVLATYAGSIVAGATTVSGVYEPHAMRHSDVNAPGSWNGTSIQQVGQGTGGYVNAIIPMGLSSFGVSPTKSILVTKSESGVFLYKGALGSLEEAIVNVPTGCRDGQTAKYIPSAEGGYVAFLSTDGKIYATDGINVRELSLPIRTELSNYVVAQLTANTSQKFFAVRNFKDFQYVVSVGGNRHYCYDWDRKNWTRYQGWAHGYMAEAENINGSPQIYCADFDNNQVVMLNEGSQDGDEDIDYYWKSAFVHCGDKGIFKVFKFLNTVYRTDLGDMVITATVNLGQGAAATVSIDAVSDPALAARWDSAVWDSDEWVASGEDSYMFYKNRSRLKVLVGAIYDSLRGYDIQLKFSQTVVGAHFEVCGAQLFYLSRGRKRVA